MKKLHKVLAGTAAVGLSFVTVPAAMAANPNYEGPGGPGYEGPGGPGYEGPGGPGYDQPGDDGFYTWGVTLTATDPNGKDVALDQVKYGDTLHLANTPEKFDMPKASFSLHSDVVKLGTFAIKAGEVKKVDHVVGCELKPGMHKAILDVDTLKDQPGYQAASHGFKIADKYENCDAAAKRTDGAGLAKTGSSSALWMLLGLATVAAGAGVVAYRKHQA